MPWFAALSVETADLLIRKLAHVSEYFIFGMMVSYVLRKRSGLTTVNQISLAISLGIVYAISDEWHQSFVPSRTASAMDVLLDTVGFICGSSCFYTSILIRQAKTVHSYTSLAPH
jgi:VanZ family protein